ncbi:sugar transferase [Segetibacter aerophilus]|uniref:Glycosyl transferase n=1 Tax=Segetibacter aerophilus TaxID=670293 RepID=A0A512BAP2_9BACT|nr:sugar transferase [Segetibacter aerophilus]GEO09034.1 glycosyl transferase [Segetibacter aerophilus]
MKMIGFFDYAFSLVGLIILSPVFLLVILLIKLTSKGPVFFKQTRVGKDGRDFKVYKFRSMFVDADKRGLLTVGGKDVRVTKAGYYLRKFKVDELPQLINVIKGEMSIVGPRPEVRKYVDLYSEDQLKALKVLPGITDYASIQYRNENDLLALSHNPEELYVKEIMPKKIELNFRYINNRSVGEYFKIIIETVITSLKGK